MPLCVRMLSYGYLVASCPTSHRHHSQSKDGGEDAAKRAWARTATQRVLDLMLVTERVRQEEQKRRVAAARASNQV